MSKKTPPLFSTQFRDTRADLDSGSDSEFSDDELAKIEDTKGSFAPVENAEMRELRETLDKSRIGGASVSQRKMTASKDLSGSSVLGKSSRGGEESGFASCTATVGTAPLSEISSPSDGLYAHTTQESGKKSKFNELSSSSSANIIPSAKPVSDKKTTSLSGGKRSIDDGKC